MVFDVNGVKLHYEVIGEGIPLLWLHGFFGAGADWRYMFPDPPGGYCLIAPDLRGHGASSRPAGVFTFRDAAQDVAALVHHLGLESVHAVGVSGGGIVLLHLATANPSLIDAMVIVSAPPYFPAQARSVQRQTSEAMFSEDELTLMRTRHRGGNAQVQQLIADCRSFAESYSDVNFTPPYLSTITARTMIVFGDRDPLYPVSLACELRRSIPDSQLWVVPGAGHAPVFGEHARSFTETALRFLRGGP
jgi:pimeloyl-ACP methyl ester carboxylesterase